MNIVPYRTVSAAPALLLISLTAAGCSGNPFGTSKKAPASPSQGCTTAALTDKVPAAKLPAGSLSVYDGQAVAASVVPYVGNLFFSADGVEGLCSASLICPNVVLTAAHCFHDGSHPIVAATSFHFSLNPTTPLTGSADDVNHLAPDSTPGVTVQINPGWTGDINQSSGPDMAILQLAHGLTAPLAPLTFAAIPDPPADGPGIAATVVGYGIASQDGSGAGTKREGTVFYEGSQQASGTSAADPGTLLTLRGTTGQDTCEGDSGGPLIINGGVYGTLSAGDSSTCGAPLGGAVQGLSAYSSVPNNKAWIQGIMQEWCGGAAPAAQTSPPAPEPCQAN